MKVIDDEFAKGTKHGITHCALCTNNKHLTAAVAADDDGVVLVWDVHKSKTNTISKTTMAKQAPLLWCKWALATNTIVVLDCGGNVVLWEDVVLCFLSQPVGITTDDVKVSGKRRFIVDKELFSSAPTAASTTSNEASGGSDVVEDVFGNEGTKDWNNQDGNDGVKDINSGDEHVM